MDIDLDFFSLFAHVSALSAVCPLGVTLASRRGHNLRDPRVEGMLQVASEPLYLFARVDRAMLIAKLAERRIRVLAGEDDGVLSSQGLLKVDIEVLQSSLQECQCNTVICYQFGLKSLSRGYWDSVQGLCDSMPGCTENKFHISKSFDGVDECGNAHICLFKGRSFNNFTCVQRFPLLKDLGAGFGSCEVRDNVMNVSVTAYATVIHIAKRHGTINLKTPKNFADVRNLIFRLEEFYSVLSGSEKDQVGGYRLELLCEAASPLDCLGQFESRVSPSFWVNSRALVAKTVPVDVFLQSIRDALDFCRLLDLSRGANDRQLSKFRKFICTDLLNYFGICKPTMARYLGASGYSSSPFTIWEHWIRNETALVQRIGRERQSSSGVARTIRTNPNVLRQREGQFTLEEDRLIIEVGLRPRERSKWEDLLGRRPDLFAARTAMQLKDRFRWLKRRGLARRS